MKALDDKGVSSEPTSRAQISLADSCEDLNSYMKALKELTDREISVEWQAMHRSPPPRISRRLLLLGIGYRFQELQAGKPLRALLEEARRRSNRLRDGSLHPGTKLVREWQGATYQVDVLEVGFRFDERTFASLSAVARDITGVNRSGPLFFGLREST